MYSDLLILRNRRARSKITMSVVMHKVRAAGRPQCRRRAMPSIEIRSQTFQMGPIYADMQEDKAIIVLDINSPSAAKRFWYSHCGRNCFARIHVYVIILVQMHARMEKYPTETAWCMLLL